MEKPVLTLEETARLLGASVKVIRKAVKAGTIKSIKLGRKTLILRGPLEEQLEANVRILPADRTGGNVDGPPKASTSPIPRRRSRKQK